MKKYIFLLFIALSGTGCNDFLEEDPKGQVVGSNAITDVTGLDAALTGSYKGVLRTWSRGFLNSSNQGFTMGGDDVTTMFGGNKDQFRQIDQFEVTSGNSHTGMIWYGCYKMIQGANNVIANAPKINGDKTRIDQITGEAYFLRALGYYWLVRGFGPIPLVTEASDVVTPDMLSMQKSQPIEVYKVIESDLTQAETLLPNTKRDPGRPNKGSAKALLADVYLTEGGWPIKDNTKYALAAAKAKEVIDNKALYNFELVPLEVLWGGNTAAIGTTEEVMAFHTSKAYGGSVNAYYGHPGTPAEEGGWEDYHAEINFFNNFPAGKRKDITFHTEFIKSDSTKVAWQNSISKHPYYGKLRLEVNNDWQSSMPVHMIRYAHVLLVYAEAQARATGMPNTNAYAALNAVRDRAGLTPLSGLSGPDFAEAVVNERAWEFAAEFTRWFDLQRLEKVEEVNMNKSPLDLQPIGAITKADYWFPVPINDAGINPNL